MPYLLTLECGLHEFETLEDVYQYEKEIINSKIPYYDPNYRYFVEYSNNYFGKIGKGEIRIMQELKNSCTVYSQVYKSFEYELSETVY